MPDVKQARKDNWEQRHVQSILDYHNSKYGTQIKIKGKAADIYPDLKGKTNWDWVCRDIKTSTEVAVEVKKILDSKVEETGNIISEILDNVGNHLSGKLPGVFWLKVEFHMDDRLPLSSTFGKQQYVNVLCETIIRAAPNLTLGESADLKSDISARVPFSLPSIFFCDLLKLEDAGSFLGTTIGSTGIGSRTLEEDEFRKFEALLCHANYQLKLSKCNETILIFIEEGRKIIDHDAVKKALKDINPNIYSETKHIYLVSGEKITKLT